MRLYVMQAKPETLEERLHAAVQDVFAATMGIRCEPAGNAGWTLRRETIGCIAGIAGAMRGFCLVQLDRASAMRIAELSAGDAKSDEASIHDAVSGLCSRIADRWKGGIPELASGCMLAEPIVIAGYDFRFHSQPPTFRIQSRYRFGTDELEVILQGEMVR
jgi:CheY-specific phosphatase CheX